MTLGAEILTSLFLNTFHSGRWQCTVTWVQLASHRWEGDLQPGKHPLDIHALKVIGRRKAKAVILGLHEEKLLCPVLE